MKDYKSLKSASKTSITKTNEGVYFLTTKNYDKKLGTELSDTIDRVNIESLDIHISSLTSTITSLTSEKADYEQLKTDLEAL